jgi:hypothetical protein
LQHYYDAILAFAKVSFTDEPFAAYIGYFAQRFYGQEGVATGCFPPPQQAQRAYRERRARG